MYYEIYDDNKNVTNYNYWNISKHEFEFIKKHISNLQYFNFPTNNILDSILNNRNLDSNKKLLINTEYEKDLTNVLQLFKQYSSIKYEDDLIDLNTFLNNHFNIKVDSIFYIIDENNTNLQELKINQDLLQIKSQMFILNKDSNYDDIKQKIILQCKNKNLNHILILNGSFLFNDSVIKDIIKNKNMINIPYNYTEFYLDYTYESTNYRYNKYVNFISAYNVEQSSFINLNSNEYNYYGIYPLLNKNINPKKETLIRKFNYMRNKYNFQTLMVNLDRRKDRFNKFISCYGDEYPNIIKFSAIDGKTFDFSKYLSMFDISEYNKYNNIKNPYQHHNYLKGVLGCSMSHYTIWNLIRKNNFIKNDDYILVLEDDINLSNDFNIKLNKLLDYLHYDNNWDVVFLGFSDYKNCNDTKINNMLIKFSGDLRLNGGGTFAYLIRKRAAIKYLEFSRKYKIQQAIDWFMIELFDKMTVYKCEPEIVFSAIANNNNSDSDVQNLNEQIIIK